MSKNHQTFTGTICTKHFAIFLFSFLLITPSAFSSDSTFCGDVESNGDISIGDLVAFVVYMFRPDSSSECGTKKEIDSTALEMDGCTGKDISDITFLTKYLFKSGNEPNCTPKPCSTGIGGALSMDSVIGLTDEGLLPLNNGTVTFNIRITSDTVHNGITNGFRVFSPDGGEWTSTHSDVMYNKMDTIFEMIFSVNEFSVDGNGADTIGFGGITLFGEGLASDFNEVVYAITIGPVPNSSAGKKICLDSSYYPPMNRWKWADINSIPAWDGPHCYSVETGVRRE